MIEHLKEFFIPTISTYSYNKSKEAITQELQEVFTRKATLFTSNDVTGRFISEDKFVVEVISFAYTKGAKFGAKLEGEIIQVETDFTIIKTILRPNPVWYMLFLLSIILSLILLYKFTSTNSIKFLFGSIGIFISGPFLSVASSNIGESSVRDRYYKHIHKKLTV